MAVKYETASFAPYDPLNEQEKELACLYAVARDLQSEDPSFEDRIKKIVDYVPLGFQFPENIAARIVVADSETHTDNFHEAERCHRSAIVDGEQQVGFIEVCCLDDRPESDEGPFLRQEGKLLDGLAVLLGSELKKVGYEKSLIESQQFINSILDATPEIVSIYNLDEHSNVYTNGGVMDVLGYTPEEIQKMGNKFHEVTLHPDDADAVLKHHESMEKAGDETIALEYRRKSSDGTWRTLLGRDKVYARNDDGTAHMILSTAVDITEHKQAEDQLRYQAAQLQNVNDAVIGSDAQHRITTWNVAAEALYGWKAEDVLGRESIDIIGTEWPDAGAKEMRRLIDKKGSWRGECTQERKDGTRFSVEVSSMVLRDESGEITGYVSVNRDITELKHSEEELRKSLASVRNAMGGIIQAFSLTVESRDPYTAGHERRVADLSQAIAGEMGLEDEQIEAIRLAAAIHDLGKIKVPAEILTNPGALTPPEFEMIRLHPETGYHILKDVDFPWNIAQIVHEHHERMDGSGYPQGISGEEISLEARIIAVADVVEAMSSHRPYRPALGIDQALEEIVSKRGVAYDAAVVDACVKIFDAGYVLIAQ